MPPAAGFTQFIAKHLGCQRTEDLIGSCRGVLQAHKVEEVLHGIKESLETG